MLVNQSENNKNNNLNDIYEDLITEIKTDYWLRHKMPRVFSVFPKYGDLWKDLFSPFVLFLNIILLVSYSKSNSNSIDDPKFWFLSIGQTNVLLLVIGIFWTYLISVIYINTIMTVAPVIINRFKIKGDLNGIIKLKSKITLKLLTGELYTIIKLALSILTDKILIFYFILLLLTLLGTIRWPFYYWYLLTYIIHRSSTLMNVLQAIWQPKFSLMMTILLLLMVVYSFSVLAFFWYSDDYPNSSWYSLWSCFVVSYDQTFKSGGGFAGYLTLPYSERSSGGVDIRYGRIIFDDVSAVLVVLLILGMISAITKL